MLRPPSITGSGQACPLTASSQRDMSDNPLAQRAQTALGREFLVAMHTGSSVFIRTLKGVPFTVQALGPLL